MHCHPVIIMYDNTDITPTGELGGAIKPAKYEREKTNIPLHK